jgi:hypothetical protein
MKENKNFLFQNRVLYFSFRMKLKSFLKEAIINN